MGRAPIPAMSKLNSSLNDGKVVVVVDVHADDCHAHTHDLLIRLRRAGMASKQLKLEKLFGFRILIRTQPSGGGRCARLDSCVRSSRVAQKVYHFINKPERI